LIIMAELKVNTAEKVFWATGGVLVAVGLLGLAEMLRIRDWEAGLVIFCGLGSGVLGWVNLVSRRDAAKSKQ